MSLLDSLEAAKALKPSSSVKIPLMKIGKGNSFELGGETYLVKNSFKYTELKKKKTRLGDSWNELEVFCIDTGETKYMEIEDDDEVLVYFTDTCKLKLRDIGVKSADHLDELVDDERSIDGFHYDDDYYARFKREGKSDEDLWVIEYENGSKWLCVEGWETDDDEYSFEVSKGRVLKERDFSVIS